jgi:hypothetical protein
MGCIENAFQIQIIKEWQKLDRVYAGFTAVMQCGDIFMDLKHLYPSVQKPSIYKSVNMNMDSIVSLGLNKQEVQWLIGLFMEIQYEIENGLNDYYLDYYNKLFRDGLKYFIATVIRELS